MAIFEYLSSVDDAPKYTAMLEFAQHLTDGSHMKKKIGIALILLLM